MLWWWDIALNRGLCWQPHCEICYNDILHWCVSSHFYRPPTPSSWSAHLIPGCLGREISWKTAGRHLRVDPVAMGLSISGKARHRNIWPSCNLHPCTHARRIDQCLNSYMKRLYFGANACFIPLWSPLTDPKDNFLSIQKIVVYKMKTKYDFSITCLDHLFFWHGSSLGTCSYLKAQHLDSSTSIL